MSTVFTVTGSVETSDQYGKSDSYFIGVFSERSEAEAAASKFEKFHDRYRNYAYALQSEMNESSVSFKL